MTQREPVSGTRQSAAGAIYDLGYRNYEGPRLGRAFAIRTLYLASLRQVFGLGRSGRAKIIPWGLTAIAIIPAAVAAAISAVVPVGNASPFNYDNYLWGMQAIIGLFVAAQAPEILSSDQRHHVLSLYFSHALSRTDYAIAKWGALATSIFIVCLAPLLVIFGGAVLAASDVPKAFGDQVGNLPQIIGAPILYAVPLSGLGLAIGAYTPRRAYASGAIIAVFIVTTAVSAILHEATRGAMSRLSPLIDPFVSIDGTRDWLLGASLPDSPVRDTQLALPVFGALSLAIALVGLGVVIWRYRRIAA